MKLLTILALTLAVWAQDEFQCPRDDFDWPIDGNYPHELDCTLYYNCWNGDAVQWSCEDGLWFDSWSMSCLHPPQSDCRANESFYAYCSVVDSNPLALNPINGEVSFRQNRTGGIMDIHVQLRNFNRSDNELLHGFHVHAGEDTSGGCAGTGSHFNPAGVDHGGPASAVRHVGDLGNIEEDSTGSVEMVIIDDMISLNPSSPNYIVHRVLNIHETIDDYGLNGDAGSLTNGNAGARIACCIVQEDTGPTRSL